MFFDRVQYQSHHKIDRQMMRSILRFLRMLRNRIPGLSYLHAKLRKPYYQILEACYPRGIEIRLSSADRFKMHPRFLGMGLDAYEPEVTKCLMENLKPGATVLDIGAHVGLHTMMFSRRVGETGKVIAVEPSPANAGMLRKHLAWNNCKNVAVIEAALSDRCGKIQFNFRADPTDPGGFANSIAYDIGGSTAEVQLTTLDDICANFCPDLIKMDVEGAELLALRGGKSILERCAAALVIAIHPEPMQHLGTSPPELTSFLGAMGYQGFHLDGRPATEYGAEEILFRKFAG